ncbi:MAG TPA: XRE family transcriptional regulator [Solirubrobacteraceae bacterium]|jgi:transcriptional regulator with XRE-family HTH domain|nr:XRE family transcriptional regulator [Solirubrobacteraceae bacterium]
MVATRNQGDDLKARLAGNLRRLRIARHLSLSGLARATSTSKATLSAIENGRGNPTLDTLTLLADALQVSVAELIEEPQMGEVRIVRASQADSGSADRVGQRRLDTITELRGSLEIFVLSLAPHCTHEMSPRTAGSRQWVLVLQGKMIAGPVERISELASGDYASFPADATHVYETGRAPARALVSAFTPGS